MTASMLTMNTPACFHLKTSFAPCTILQLIRYDLEALETQIIDTIKRAPKFFQGSPIIIDLEKLAQIDLINFAQIKQILLANGMVPVGVRGGSDEQHSVAASNGLPVLSVGKLSHNEPISKKKTEERKHATKLVAHPIRSGMQVYARDGDLVVTASVSAGAELLSDGHIHVYGPLRGRALAGVQGNKDARIFCSTLEAELVSIAGYYLTKEDMQQLPESRGMIQIYLAEDQVRIETIA